MMKQLLEEHRYSQKGSVVETDSSEDEDDERTIYAIQSGASSSKRGNYGADATLSMLRLDRSTITRAMRKRLRIVELRGVIDNSGVNKKRANSVVLVEDHNDNAIDVSEDDVKATDGDSTGRGGRKKKHKKKKRGHATRTVVTDVGGSCIPIVGSGNVHANQDQSMENGEEGNENNELGVDESSIFGQTTGSSNATWVECDKCKKVRIVFL